MTRDADRNEDLLQLIRQARKKYPDLTLCRIIHVAATLEVVELTSIEEVTDEALLTGLRHLLTNNQ